MQKLESIRYISRAFSRCSVFQYPARHDVKLSDSESTRDRIFFRKVSVFNPLSGTNFIRYGSQDSGQGTQEGHGDKGVNAPSEKKVSQRSRLKQIFKEYGATIVVFHVTISLASLGLCYLVISNGFDVIAFLRKLGISESVITSQMALGSSTFVISYAFYKVFAPVRMAITISAAPFIVRYLRKIKILKTPK